MGRIEIKRVSASDSELSEISIESFLRSLKVHKQGASYFISLGSTEVEISADLMKDLIENAFMMLDYDDQKELMKVFDSYMRGY